MKHTILYEDKDFRVEVENYEAFGKGVDIILWEYQWCDQEQAWGWSFEMVDELNALGIYRVLRRAGLIK